MAVDGPGAPIGSGHGDADGPVSDAALLADLDAEQREVARAVRGPVCVLAGAGTGKTRAITYRIGYAVRTGVVAPERVFAVTFTVRAAGELRARLHRLAGAGLGTGAVTVSTFHAAALRQLGYFWPHVVGGRPPQLTGSKTVLAAEAARTLRLRATRAAIVDAVAEIEWAKVTQVRPGDYPHAAAAAGRVLSMPAADLAALFDTYERLRRERHLVDFESALELTAAILADSRWAAGQVRDRYRHFVVDEYQDVNPLQKLLLDQWLGGRDDLCVVGDPQQTIYSFAGATHGYLTAFLGEFPRATVVQLRRDYRSTPQVVALANRFAGSGASLVAARPAGPQPVLTEYPDEDAEAAGVAAAARELIDAGQAAREIAILVRSNGQAERFERALRAVGVAYQVRTADRFYDRPEVRQAMMLLRGALRAVADEANRPLPEQVAGVLSGLGFAASAPARGTIGAGPAGGSARQRWESLAAISALAHQMHAATPAATLDDFVAELARRQELGQAPTADAVTVSSIHAAKGLEWDAVAVPGLVDGNIPVAYAHTREAVAEERRLLYVAVTRARSRVFLSWAAVRKPGDSARRRPSRFLDEVRGVVTVARPAGNGAAGATPATHRSTAAPAATSSGFAARTRRRDEAARRGPAPLRSAEKGVAPGETAP